MKVIKVRKYTRNTTSRNTQTVLRLIQDFSVTIKDIPPPLKREYKRMKHEEEDFECGIHQDLYTCMNPIDLQTLCKLRRPLCKSILETFKRESSDVPLDLEQ